MKKALMLFVVGALLLTPVIGSAGIYKNKEQEVALHLSRSIPGTGEWYNNDFRGSYPWGECILGCCFLVQWSSMFDAVNGNTDSKLRFDFWTPPR